MAVVLTILSACQKENLTTGNEISSYTQDLTGVAHFSSQLNFDNSIESLRNNSLLPVEMNNVISLNQDQRLKSSEYEVEEDTLIHSELVKELLNNQYEIAIGNVFFRITEQGTFFTTLDNYKWLSELNIDDESLVDAEPINLALGYSFENGMYEVAKYENLYFYDTFRKIEPITEYPNIDLQVLKSTSFPSESEWLDTNDGRTIAGKAWDDIWGFSKSVHNYFDSKHRVDAKFYAQRFPFYSEMGIKTKTQKKGWTGIWSKQDCDEIINGWEILNLQEKWPTSFFGPSFNINSHFPTFTFQTQTVKDLNYSQSRFLSQHWKTFNIMGLELDFSQKDKIGALWNVSKSLGKASVSYVNKKLNPNNTMEAIRLIPPSVSASTTEISLAPYSDSRVNTDKYTIIFANSSGGTISVTYSGGDGFGYDKYTNLTAKYTFLKNTIMYGAARRGSVWRGVRITFD